MSIAEIRN